MLPEYLVRGCTSARPSLPTRSTTPTPILLNFAKRGLVESFKHEAPERERLVALAIDNYRMNEHAGDLAHQNPALGLETRHGHATKAPRFSRPEVLRSHVLPSI